MVSKSGYSRFFSRADSKYTKGLSKSTHFFAKGNNKYLNPLLGRLNGLVSPEKIGGEHLVAWPL